MATSSTPGSAARTTGVSANAVTLTRLALAATGGLLLGFGVFSWAALLMLCASLGDAIDGPLAPRTQTASPGGALLDASVDATRSSFSWAVSRFTSGPVPRRSPSPSPRSPAPLW